MSKSFDVEIIERHCADETLDRADKLAPAALRVYREDGSYWLAVGLASEEASRVVGKCAAHWSKTDNGFVIIVR